MDGMGYGNGFVMFRGSTMAIDYRWAVVECCMSLGVGTSHMPVLLAPIPSIGEQKQSARGAVLIVMSKNELFGWAFYSTKGRNKLTVEHQPVTMFCLDRYIILGTWKIAQKAAADTVDGGNQANNLGCIYKPCKYWGRKNYQPQLVSLPDFWTINGGCCISRGSQFL